MSNYPNGGETEGLKLLYGGKIFDMTSEGNGNHILKANIPYYKFTLYSVHSFAQKYSLYRVQVQGNLHVCIV